MGEGQASKKLDAPRQQQLDALGRKRKSQKSSIGGHEVTKIRVVEMVVVTMQNGRKPCTAITWGSSESLGNTQFQAYFKTCPQHCKTSTPGSNPGGASNFS